MIGAHELLLIVRAQNQASAALGRVGRDLARLQQQRDMRARASALQTRQMQEALRLAQLEEGVGTRSLAIQQARLRTNNQIQHTLERQAQLDIRSTAIASGRANLDLQRVKLNNQILNIEEDQAAVIKRQQLDLEKTRATMAAMAAPVTRGAGGRFLPAADRDPGGLSRQAAILAQHRAATARMLAEQRVAAAQESDAPSAIAQRRLTEAKMAEAIATGRIKEMDAALKSLARTEQEQVADLAKLTNESNKYTRRIQEINVQIKNLQYGFESLNARERAVMNTNQQMSRSIQELNAELNILSAREREAASQAEILRRQMAATKDQMMQVNSAVAGQRWEQLQMGARAVSHFGRIAQMTGMITTAAFGAAAASAAKLNTEATLAGSQMSRSAGMMVKNGEAIQSAIVDTMSQGTSSSEDLSAAIYDIFSSTNIQSLQKGTKFLKLMSDVAIAGQTNVQDATNLTIEVFNNFGGPIRKRVEQMFSAVRYGAITFEEYSQSLSQLVPAFKGAGQGFDELNAAFAQSTRQLAPSFARTGLARLIEIFQRKTFQQGMRAVGVSITDATGKLIPFHEIITKIAKRFPEIAKGRKGVQEFVREITKAGGAPAGQAGTIQAARVAQVLIDRYQNYNALVKDVTGNTKQFTNQLKAMEQSTGVKWAEFVNQMKALVLIVGASAIPVFTRFGTVFKTVVDYLKLHPEVAKAVGYFGTLVGIITLLGGSLLVVVGSIAAFILSMRTIGGTLKTLTGGGAAAAGEMDILSGSAGILATRFGLWGGAIAVLILALPVLAKHMDTVSGAIGGIQGALIALNVAMTLFTLRSLAGRLAILGFSRVLVTNLAIMTGGEAIIIGFGAVIVSQLIRKIPYWNKAFESLGGAIYDLTHKAADTKFAEPDVVKKNIDTATKYFQKLRDLGMDPKVMRKIFEIHFPKWNDHEMNAYFHAAKNAYKRLQDMRNYDPLSSNFAPPQFDTTRQFTGTMTNKQFITEMQHLAKLKTAAENYHATNAAGQLKYMKMLFTIDRVENQIKNHATEFQKNNFDAVLASLQKQGGLSDKVFFKQYQQAQRLFQQAQSSGAFAAWKKYYDYVEALGNKASQSQMAAAEKVFGQIEKQATLTNAQAASKTSQLAGLQRQFNIAPTMQGAEAITKLQKQLEALTPAQQMFFDKINENMKIFSDQEAVKAYAQVQRLKEAFDKAPSLAAWEAWFAANQSFTQRFTQDQQQAAQDIEAAHKAATEKIKQDYQSLLDKVRSTFDEIRSANVSAFGQLGSGPVVSGLNDRVNQIKDAATRQSDAIRASGDKRANALKEQADRIQQAFDDSVSKISASQGNLIDWGLAPNPEDQRAAVTSQVRSLNEQADRIKKASDAAADKIEKNAAARADALAKRLAAHKLTGGEIVADLQAQVKAFTNWNNDLNAIAKRGAPSALVEQLRALGPEFDPMLKAIRGMSPAMFKKYVAIFNQGQKEIDKASLAATAARLKKEYPLYIQQGKNISDWLAQGVQENPALRNAFVKIMRSVFGTGSGPTPKAPAPKGKAGARSPQSATHVTHNNTYNYHGGSMDYSTWMRKNHFKTRNQTRC